MKKVYIPTAKPCDIRPCKAPAEYDAPTISGPWANMCGDHYESLAAGHATSVAYQLVVGDEPVKSTSDLRKEIHAAIERGDAEEVWDLVGDGDLVDFL